MSIRMMAWGGLKRLACGLASIFLAGTAVAAIEVTDDAGKRVTLQQPARRIVALAPHATELVYAAGAGTRLVGVVDYSDYPPAARTLPRVGGYEQLNLEAIATLRPDLVVAWQSGNPPAVVDKLRALGLVVYLSEPRLLDDIPRNIERLGRLAGTMGTAAAAAAAFRQRIDRLRRQYAHATPVRVFYQVWSAPLMTVNGQHAISHVIELCGGRNIFAGLSGLAPQVDREAVLLADPQVILGGAMGTGERGFDTWRRWPALTAVKFDTIYSIDADLLQRQGPRLAAGAEQVCRILAQARQRLARGEAGRGADGG